MSTQEIIYEKIKAVYQDAVVKKINKDNYLDIYLPSVNDKKGTHLFFNTSKGKIKLGFYCREDDFVESKLSSSVLLEEYSQGLRLKDNPVFDTIETAIEAAQMLIGEISSGGNATVSNPSVTNNVRDVVDTSEPNGGLLESSGSEEYSFEDPLPFLTRVQLFKMYFQSISQSSSIVEEFEKRIKEFTITSVVPRISNDVIRAVHLNGGEFPLLLKTMLNAEDIYDGDVYDTHNDYVKDLYEGEHFSAFMIHENLILETIAFLIEIGNRLDSDASPTGSLTVQDRYYPVFTILSSKTKLEVEPLKRILGKIVYDEVGTLLLKASGYLSELSADEKLALMLYDFILVDEDDGLDIKMTDISSARKIFSEMATKPGVAESLIGGFNDNYSFELFLFYNVAFNRKGFHDLCLACWSEMTQEMNAEITKKIMDSVSIRFHTKTYMLNPVKNDYLKVYNGERTMANLSPSDPSDQMSSASSTAKETIKASDLSLADSLTFLYIACAGADGKVSEAEMKVLIEELNGWSKDGSLISSEHFELLLESWMSMSNDEEVTLVRDIAVNLKNKMDENQLHAVAKDLVKIANAEDGINSEELGFLNMLIQTWELRIG